MSFVAWKILRRLPKPLLLVLLIFVLAAAARASFGSRLTLNRATMMTAHDFRRVALSLESAEESSHMGQPDFRVRGKIFATLASEDQGYGNLKLSPEQQAEFVEELPQVFIPIPGGWGKMGMTHIRLSAATEEVLTGALRTGSIGTRRAEGAGDQVRGRSDHKLI